MASIFRIKMEKQPDETVYLLCSPCKRKERNKEADKYCADCHDYYCSDCVKCHEDIPALSGHKIIDKDHVKDGTRETLPVIPTQRCEKHRFKLVDMYCQGHDNVGCSTCMTVDHRSCNDVSYVPEYVLNHNPTIQCEDVQRKMLAVTGDIEFQLNIRQWEVKRLFKRKVEVVEKIKQLRIDINQKLYNLEKKSIDTIEGKYKALIKQFEEQITILKKFQTDVQSSAEELKSALSNVSQKFVEMKVANSVTERADNGLKENTIMEFKRFDVVFEGQPRLMSMIDHMEILGEIVEKPAIYRLGEKRETSIKHDSDTSTNNDILSLCMLKDSCVIIADNKNKRFKRFDVTSSKIFDVCQLPRCPWQICEVDNEIAVSSGCMNIDIVTTDGPLKLARKKNDHTCFGLGYRHGKIYVTDSSQTVYVYNKTGIMLIQFSKDQSGDNLFSDMYSLTVSHDGERIYVADHAFGLVVISKKGKLRGKYNTSNLTRAREICETDSGGILVCGELSNNIVQFFSKW